MNFSPGEKFIAQWIMCPLFSSSTESRGLNNLPFMEANETV